MKSLKVSTFLLSTATIFIYALPPVYAGMPDFSRVDPIATCKDISIGNDTQVAENISDNSWKSHDISDVKDTHDVKDTEDNSSKDSEKTSGGGSFMGISAQGSHEESHEKQRKTDNSYKDDNSYKTAHQFEQIDKHSNKASISTVRAGKDCNGALDATAKVEVSKQDNETARYLADKKAEAEIEKVQAESRAKMMQGLMNW